EQDAAPGASGVLLKRRSHRGQRTCLSLLIRSGAIRFVCAVLRVAVATPPACIGYALVRVVVGQGGGRGCFVLRPVQARFGGGQRPLGGLAGVGVIPAIRLRRG